MKQDDFVSLGSFELFSDDSDDQFLPFRAQKSTSDNRLDSTVAPEVPSGTGRADISSSGSVIGGQVGFGSINMVSAGIDASDPPELSAMRSFSAGTATWVLPHAITFPQSAPIGSVESNSAEGLAVLAAPGPAGTLQTLAEYLRVGYWHDSNAAEPRWFNVTSAGAGANSGTLYYNVTGWKGSLSTVYGNEYDKNGISDFHKNMVREAFAVYSAITGINFVETTSTSRNVDFFFKNNSLGAYEAEQLMSGIGGPMDYGVINVAKGWSDGDAFQTFLHEIGHALGLGHQGLYNAAPGQPDPTYADNANWANDSWTQTMMSYWDQYENTETSADSYAELISPMAVDWIALNRLYSDQGFGTKKNAFTDDTIWGVGTNISAATSVAFNGLAGFADTNAFTIVDGRGVDTIDFSNYSAPQMIDLTPSLANSTHATRSSVGGLTYNMTLAVGTIIENATTGGGDDTIYGNARNNVLTGNGGNDFIYGDVDSLHRGVSDDILYGGSGSDVLYGEDAVLLDGVFEGNDALYGGTGSDVLYGGTGHDTLYGGSGGDVLYGGDGNDMLYGGTGSDVLYGGEGNNIFYSAGGQNTLVGGNRSDTYVLSFSSSAVLPTIEEPSFLDTGNYGRDTIILKGNPSGAIELGVVADIEDFIYAGTVAADISIIESKFPDASLNIARSFSFYFNDLGGNLHLSGDGTYPDSQGRVDVFCGTGSDVIIFDASFKPKMSSLDVYFGDFDAGIDKIDLTSFHLKGVIDEAGDPPTTAGWYFFADWDRYYLQLVEYAGEGDGIYQNDGIFLAHIFGYSLTDILI